MAKIFGGILWYRAFSICCMGRRPGIDDEKKSVIILKEIARVTGFHILMELKFLSLKIRQLNF